MDNKLGIQNLKIVIGAAIEMYQQIDASLADKKISIGEGISFLPQLANLPNAVEAAKRAPAEILDLDQEEQKEIFNYFAQRFDIANDKVEEAIELSLHYALQTASYGLQMNRLLSKKIA